MATRNSETTVIATIHVARMKKGQQLRTDERGTERDIQQLQIGPRLLEPGSEWTQSSMEALGKKNINLHKTLAKRYG